MIENVTDNAEAEHSLELKLAESNSELQCKIQTNLESKPGYKILNTNFLNFRITTRLLMGTLKGQALGHLPFATVHSFHKTRRLNSIGRPLISVNVANVRLRLYMLCFKAKPRKFPEASQT